MRDREVALDGARFDALVAAYATADPAPVVVGHPSDYAPAYGWVDRLRRVGDRLQARLCDVAPAFREAVEAGRYAGRSIALVNNRLRHLGFLGGRAPAIPGLAPTQFSSVPDAVVEFVGDLGGAGGGGSDRAVVARALELQRAALADGRPITAAQAVDWATDEASPGGQLSAGGGGSDRAVVARALELQRAALADGRPITATQAVDLVCEEQASLAEVQNVIRSIESMIALPMQGLARQLGDKARCVIRDARTQITRGDYSGALDTLVEAQDIGDALRALEGGDTTTARRILG